MDDDVEDDERDLDENEALEAVGLNWGEMEHCGPCHDLKVVNRIVVLDERHADVCCGVYESLVTMEGPDALAESTIR